MAYQQSEIMIGSFDDTLQSSTSEAGYVVRSIDRNVVVFRFHVPLARRDLVFPRSGGRHIGFAW